MSPSPRPRGTTVITNTMMLRLRARLSPALRLNRMPRSSQKTNQKLSQKETGKVTRQLQIKLDNPSHWSSSLPSSSSGTKPQLNCDFYRKEIVLEKQGFLTHYYPSI